MNVNEHKKTITNETISKWVFDTVDRSVSDAYKIKNQIINSLPNYTIGQLFNENIFTEIHNTSSENIQNVLWEIYNTPSENIINLFSINIFDEDEDDDLVNDIIEPETILI